MLSLSNINTLFCCTERTVYITDRLKYCTAPSHWSNGRFGTMTAGPRSPPPADSQSWPWNHSDDIRAFLPQKKKLKAINPSLKSDTSLWGVSGSFVVQYKWIIRGLSVEVGTLFGHEDAAVWRQALFLFFFLLTLPDPERSESLWWVFSNAILSRESSVWSHLLQVE